MGVIDKIRGAVAVSVLCAMISPLVFCENESKAVEIASGSALEEKKEEQNLPGDFPTEQNKFVYQKDGTSIVYQGNQIKKVIWNEKEIKLDKEMPGIVIDGTLMVPLRLVIDNAALCGTYSVSRGGIVVERAGYELYFQEDSEIVTVNGVNKMLKSVAQTIEYSGAKYFMVPAYDLFRNLGADKITVENSGTELCVVKRTGTFLDWKFEKRTGLSANQLERIRTIYQGTKECTTIQFSKMPDYKKSVSTSQITFVMKNTRVEELREGSLLDARYTKKIVLKQQGANLQITIKKKSGIKYVVQHGSKALRIYMNMTPIKIAVDCGHGAYTSGKRTPKMPINVDFENDGKVDVKKGGTIKEHQANVGVGKVLAKELERNGFVVYRSAFGSWDVPLSVRQKNIRKFGAKYSVSVHFNAVGTGRSFNKANGMEVYYHSKGARNSSGFAKAVLNQMAKGTKQTNRGVKRAGFAMCNAGVMNTSASILVECAFMTNYHEAKTMVGNAKYWKETGIEIAKGICNYTGVGYLE